ncbi:MAG: GAF domain-containing protein [Anaerolineae bacterium]|nr:GAF domain-containing protein [Anaerolineae bacterium]
MIQTVKTEPIVHNTSVPVSVILELAAMGMTLTEIMAELPQLTVEDIKSAFHYSADVMRQQSNGGHVSPVTAQQVGEFDLHKILVVDDLPTNRRLTSLMFRGSEFEVELAASAKEALERVLEVRPFLVLTDIQMPEMTGLELCQRLKADEATKSVAVIFVTAHGGGARQVSEGLELGGDDYIPRPFERIELLSRVRAIARLKKAELEAHHQTRLAERRNKELELLNALGLASNSSLAWQDAFQDSITKLVDLLPVEMAGLLLLESPTKLWVNLTHQDGHITSYVKDVSFDEDIELLTFQSYTQELMYSEMERIMPSADTQDYTFRPIPMASRERVIGTLAIVYPKHKTLTTSDWMLLNAAAGLVTVAMDNVYLFQSVQQQVSDLSLINEVGQTLTSTLDLNQILKQTTQLVQEALQAEAASVWLVAEDASELELMASSGPGAQLVTGYRLPLGNGIAGYVALNGEPYFSANVADDEHFFKHVSQVSDFTPGSLLCVPLKLKGRVVGVLQAMHTEKYRFDITDLRLFESVASEVGIAVDNAELFAEVQAFNRQLEQRVAERTRELLEEKEKTEAILASMADGLLVLDAQRRISTANVVAEQMFGCKLSEVQGVTVDSDLFSGALWEAIQNITLGDAAQSLASVDFPDPSRPGGVLTIQPHSSMIRDDAGGVLGSVIVLHDITALKEIERMKSRFMAGVTHELKTPLAVVKTHVSNLLRYYRRLPRRKRDELLHAIERQVGLLEELVEGILALSRLDSGAVQLARSPIDFIDLVDSIVRDLLPLAVKKNITLRWKKPRQKLEILGDVKQIERVVRNLVENAIKYTSDRGTVEVYTEQDTESIVFTVVDTGIGIAPENHDKIFERFYRVDPSHTIPGTGLGLSIVREIVLAHSGEITVDSVLGKGSTFIVHFPKAKS